LFRYELRRWHDGVISNERQAASTIVGVDLDRAERLSDLVPSVPTPVWGRDELGTGDVELELGDVVAPRAGPIRHHPTRAAGQRPGPRLACRPRGGRRVPVGSTDLITT
jgi:hypothetical protein